MAMIRQGVDALVKNFLYGHHGIFILGSYVDERQERGEDRIAEQGA
jgi:hypothetical protein